MSDRVSVSNLALALLGETDKLTDPQDDSKAATSIARVWDDVRDATLREHLWNFAIGRAVLTASSVAPAFGWAYAFPLPEDFIRLDLDRLEPVQLRGEHEIEGRSLLADSLGPIMIRYVKRVAEVGLWDAAFVKAFACHLAWWIADDITGDTGRKDRAWQAYQTAVREAKGIDGRENPAEPPIETSWATARYDGYGTLGMWGRRTF